MPEPDRPPGGPHPLESELLERLRSVNIIPLSTPGPIYQIPQSRQGRSSVRCVVCRFEGERSLPARLLRGEASSVMREIREARILGQPFPGRDSASVLRAVSEIPEIEAVGERRTVRAEGAGDDWQPAMRDAAAAAMRRRRAGLAVTGLVKVPGRHACLWISVLGGTDDFWMGDAHGYDLEGGRPERAFLDRLGACAAQARRIQGGTVPRKTPYSTL